MKTSFIYSVLAFVLMTAFVSCSDDEVKPDPTKGLTKITDGYALGAALHVEVWADEPLHVGYNRIYYALYDSITKKRITDSHVHLHPNMKMHGGMEHGCPVEDPLNENAVDGLFPGAIMFTMASTEVDTWELEVRVHNHETEKFGKALFPVTVVNPEESSMEVFLAGETRFYLAYIFTNKKRVGINDMEWIVYKQDGDHGYAAVEDLSIEVIPEMPSMGHGSPNNVDPVYISQGHYAGKINFTMTGPWRLNVVLSQNNEPVKETYFDVMVK